MKPTTLTKSRFKLAVECPGKLVYATDERYVNALEQDDVLKALADGGHQVGELAKRMFPQGSEVCAPGIEEQVKQTEEMLQQPSVTVFEATIRSENLIVRADILVKRGQSVDLIEVKSKSYDLGRPDKRFRDAKDRIRPEWRPYLEDVAFQTYVLRQAKPHWKVTPYLMLVNPGARCSAALGTQMRVSKCRGHAAVSVDPNLRADNLVEAVLIRHDVTGEVDEILRGRLGGDTDFPNFVHHLATMLDRGEEPLPKLGRHCRSCEFYCGPEERTELKRSGWAECLERQFGRPVDVPRSQTVFGLYRDTRKALNTQLAGRRFRLSELSDDDVNARVEPEIISTTHRHLLQVEEARGGAPPYFLRANGLRRAFATWKFPLHFVDFETARPVLPLHPDRKPNEQLLFQFSHHMLDNEDRLSHRTDCLVATPGLVPNAPVVRALRAALSGDSGTIIHWWSHERIVLGDVRRQLNESSERDKQELVAFIDSLLKPNDGAKARLVDFGRLVERHAFFADTGGSSSIKRVLPAVLQQSEFLQQRYSKPIYGTQTMPSLNFEPGWIWVRRQENQIVNPYRLLNGESGDRCRNGLREAESGADSSDVVANGSAAMVAYAELQRVDLTSIDRSSYEKRLRRYCELDTLAMVMVFQALREWVKTSRPNRDHLSSGTPMATSADGIGAKRPME